MDRRHHGIHPIATRYAMLERTIGCFSMGLGKGVMGLSEVG